MLLTKAQVQDRLTRLGACWYANMDDQHELWGCVWGYFFYVPIANPHFMLDELDVIEIEQGIRQSKP